MTARGPRIAKTVTKSVTVSTKAEFTAEELRKRLRLPAGTALSVRYADDNLAQPVLVAEWSVSR